jgi:hypothetical protein
VTYISSNSRNLLQFLKKNPIENHTPFPMVSRNPYSNLKSENSQYYAQKPERECTFKNSSSGFTFSEGGHVDDPGVVSFELLDQLLCGHIPDEDVLSHPSDGSVLPLQNAGKVMKVLNSLSKTLKENIKIHRQGDKIVTP